MNNHIKYLIENILDDFNDNNQLNIIDNFLYLYFPENKNQLIKIINEHYKNYNYNLNDIDTSKITDFSDLFYNDFYTLDKDFDISLWDVSNGKDFSYMFYGCEHFNCDLSLWNVSNSEDFSYMFFNCANFNSNLSKWDVTNSDNFKFMFSGCHQFNSDLSKWDINKYSYIENMFKDCDNIEEQNIPKSLLKNINYISNGN